MRIKKFDKYIKEFIENDIVQNEISSKMEELKDFLSNKENYEFDWSFKEKQKDHTINQKCLLVFIKTHKEKISYEFNLETLEFKKYENDTISENLKLNDIEECLDKIEKDIHGLVEIYENFYEMRLIQNRRKNFNQFINENKKDEFWNKNYKKLIDVSSDDDFSSLLYPRSYKRIWKDCTPKHNALFLLSTYSIEELKNIIGSFEKVTKDIDLINNITKSKILKGNI